MQETFLQKFGKLEEREYNRGRSNSPDHFLDSDATTAITGLTKPQAAIKYRQSNDLKQPNADISNIQN